MFLPLQLNLQAPRLYAVIAPASGWTDPTDLQVLQGKDGNGNPATWYGSTPAPSSSTTFDWPSVATGLTAGVSYRLAVVWSDGAQKSNVAVSASFTTTSGVTILPTGIASAEAFGTHTLVRVSLASIAPSSILSGEAFGTAIFLRISRRTVAPTGIASLEAFGTQTFTGTTPSGVVPSGIPSAEVFGSATFGRISRRTVSPSGIASAEAFPTHVFSGTFLNTIFPGGIPSAEAFGTAVVRLRANLLPSGIPSAEAFGTPIFSSPSAPTITLSNRFIGPRVGLRSNGELIILF